MIDTGSGNRCPPALPAGEAGWVELL